MRGPSVTHYSPKSNDETGFSFAHMPDKRSDEQVAEHSVVSRMILVYLLALCSVLTRGSTIKSR